MELFDYVEMFYNQRRCPMSARTFDCPLVTPSSMPNETSTPVPSTSADADRSIPPAD
jgi:hypothetical protein